MIPQTVLAGPDWIEQQDPAAWLTEQEQTVWAAFASPKRRSDWLAGRLAAKRLLQNAFAVAPLDCRIGREGVAPCAWGQVPPGLNLSLSHSGGLGAASWAWTETQGTVGLDLQQLRPVSPRLAARILTDDETAQWQALFPANDQSISDRNGGLLLFWTLKEAALKARRRPWTGALRDLRVSLSSPGHAAILVPGETPMVAAYERQETAWLARALRPAEN